MLPVHMRHPHPTPLLQQQAGLLTGWVQRWGRPLILG